MAESAPESAPAETTPPRGGAGSRPPAAPSGDLGWSQVWHVPVLLAGIGLFVLGIYLSLPDEPDHDLPGALRSVEQYLDARELDRAEAKLREIESLKAHATEAELGRF